LKEQNKMAPVPDAARQRVEELRRMMEEHNYSYYVLDRPVISDREYDTLMQELITLEQAYPELLAPDSPSQRVGGGLREQFKTVQHPRALLSLNDTFNEGDLLDFDRRVRAITGRPTAYVVEPKIDGLSVALTYTDGIFTLGSSWRKDPAAALRGLAKSGSPLSSRSAFRRAKAVLALPTPAMPLPGLCASWIPG